MPWHEFTDLLSSLGPDTPLGRIVSIRLEDDEEVLERFTTDQRRIHNEWQKRIAANRTEEETNNFISAMQNALMKMAGGD